RRIARVALFDGALQDRRDVHAGGAADRRQNGRDRLGEAADEAAERAAVALIDQVGFADGDAIDRAGGIGDEALELVEQEDLARVLARLGPGLSEILDRLRDGVTLRFDRRRGPLREQLARLAVGFGRQDDVGAEADRLHFLADLLQLAFG